MVLCHFWSWDLKCWTDELTKQEVDELVEKANNMKGKVLQRDENGRAEITLYDESELDLRFDTMWMLAQMRNKYNGIGITTRGISYI